jgi:hypothetical protein
MAIKGGLPKTSPPPSQQERDAFISGAPGKTTYPWQDPRVRSDVMVQVNVKQPEDLMLQIDWLVNQGEAKNKRQLIEDLLREGAASRLHRRGIKN